jgi:hypothetical protein
MYKLSQKAEDVIDRAIFITDFSKNISTLKLILIDVIEFELKQLASEEAILKRNKVFTKKRLPSEISAEEHARLLKVVFQQPNKPLPRREVLVKMAAAYGVGFTKLEAATGYLAYLLETGFLEKSGTAFFATDRILSPVGSIKELAKDAKDYLNY